MEMAREILMELFVLLKLLIEFNFVHQIVELNDAVAVNSTSVRLHWQLHISRSELYIEVRFNEHI